MFTNHDLSKGTYTEIDGGGESRFLIKSQLIKLLTTVNKIDFEKILSNEEFVRHYIQNYSDEIDKTINSWVVAFDRADKIRKSTIKIKEAYSNFEKERLLKLLPEKQDEAPKTRTKI